MRRDRATDVPVIGGDGLWRRPLPGQFELRRVERDCLGVLTPAEQASLADALARLIAAV